VALQTHWTFPVARRLCTIHRLTNVYLWRWLLLLRPCRFHYSPCYLSIRPTSDATVATGPAAEAAAYDHVRARCDLNFDK